MVDDLSLVLSVKQGNTHALGLLYDKYAPALMGIICRITHNKEEAEEILQISFVNIRNQIGSFNSSGNSLLTWLINTARKTASDRFKSVQTTNPGANDTVYGLPGQENEESGHLVPSLEEISFDLVYYKGLNCSEAAAALKISVDELKKNIRNAVKIRKEAKFA